MPSTHISAPAPEADLESRAAATATRGQALFRLDLAAALARDWAERELLSALVEEVAVDAGPDGHVAYLLGWHGGRPDLLATVRFSADGRPLGEVHAPPISPRTRIERIARALAHARTRGGADALLIAIPSAGGDAPVEVYVLPPRDRPGLGTRLVVDPSRGVQSAAAVGELPAADQDRIVYTLDPIPSELHTLAAARRDRDLTVVTPASNRTWTVTARPASTAT